MSKTTEQTEDQAPEEVVEAPAPTEGGTGQEPGTTEDQPTGEEETTEEEAKTFTLDYVQKLRKESAGYRERAGKADDLAARLHAALVTGTGKLQDATDLPFDPAHLESPEALTAAIDGLLAAKPHLASRRPQGSIPQGATPEENTGMTLGGLLRANA